jgi:peroxiredoxin
MKALRDQSKAPFPLMVGDIAPNFVLPTADGHTLDLRGDSIGGKAIVLVFCPKFNGAVRDLVAAFRGSLESFRAAHAELLLVTTRPETTSAQNLPFKMLFDRDGTAFRTFGANRHDLPTTIVLRPNYHVVGIFDSVSTSQMQHALSVVERIAAARAAKLMDIHPPVLMIPEVLSGEDCKRLVNVVETRGQTFVDPGPGIDYFGDDYKMRIPEHMREDRVDHWIFDKDTSGFLQHRLQRVWPEIRKAFQYQITKQEALRIGCYQGCRGGYLHGHRDDVPPTTYRRFAMSINLNTEEFEGGELRFPEFGDQRYRPETGTAIVFSSSLLHEAMHVTAGRRLVLLAFLFGDH